MPTVNCEQCAVASSNVCMMKIVASPVTSGAIWSGLTYRMEWEFSCLFEGYCKFFRAKLIDFVTTFHLFSCARLCVPHPLFHCLATQLAEEPWWRAGTWLWKHKYNIKFHLLRRAAHFKKISSPFPVIDERVSRKNTDTKERLLRFMGLSVRLRLVTVSHSKTRAESPDSSHW